MHSTASDSSSTRNAKQNVATIGNRIQDTAREGVDILKENPVLTLVAVGVLGFAVGALAGRSSVRRHGALDTSWDSLHRAINAARSGTSDRVDSWRQSLKNEGLSPEQLPNRVKQQFRKLLASISD